MSDFFLCLDKKIAKVREGMHANDTLISDPNLSSAEFFKHKIPTLGQSLQNFVTELANRGIDAKSSSSERFRGIRLRYKKGPSVPLKCRFATAISAIEINTLQWDGNSLKREVWIYPIAEWRDVILDSELKALVNNFMIKAEEYGI